MFQVAHQPAEAAVPGLNPSYHTNGPEALQGSLCNTVRSVGRRENFTKKKSRTDAPYSINFSAIALYMSIFFVV